MSFAKALNKKHFYQQLMHREKLVMLERVDHGKIPSEVLIQFNTENFSMKF